MKLRTKILIITSATFAGLLVGLYISSRVIVLSGFGDIEQRDAGENVQRVQRAISEDTNRISSITGDWAAWDDTYQFIGDANGAYIASNMVAGTFTNLNVDTMLFVNTDGRVVYSRSVDLKTHAQSDLTPESQAELLANKAIYQHTSPESSLSGVLLLPDGPMLVASRPILTSDRQ